MKKQINPTIKAHLLRGALYAPMLVAICAIPFALAQQGSKESAANHAASGDMPVVQSADGAFRGTQAVHNQSVFPLTPTGAACTYVIAQIGGSIVPGTTDTGNHADDGDTFVALPFSFQLYDQTFNGVNVSSNGRLDFVTINEPGGFSSACLPAPANVGPYDYTVFPLWSDYRTDIVGEGCSSFPTGCGVFTSVVGSAPNRVFNIEWRAVYFADHNQTANFEARLYENNPNKRFDFVFGTVQPGSDQLYVSGVQGPGGVFTQDFCDTNPPAAGSRSYLCETIVPTDFNHDRFPDFVLFNGGTHRTAIWFLNNNSFMGSAFGPTLPAGWNLIDTGDFDGDSDVDYVLFNATTRHTAIWYLTGTTFMSGAFGPMLPSGWALVATGDFNGDGHPDYVLYNASSRRTAIWFLNNNVFTSASFGPTVPAGWSLAGVADFNHDGNLDYALFNAGTRQTAIWHLNGTSFMSSAFGPTPPPGWELTGVADFDRNGSPDYLLFNAAMRKTAIWYLNNNVFMSGAFGPTLVAGFNLVAP